MASFTVNKDISAKVGPFEFSILAGATQYAPDDLMDEVVRVIEHTPGGFIVTQLTTDRTDSAAPSGAAGGDLSGTYPDPAVQNDSHAHTTATISGTVNTGAAAGGDLSGTYPSPTVVRTTLPGYEIDYVARTTPMNITATAESTADTFISSSAVTYDGSTIIKIEFYAPYWRPAAAATALLQAYLYDGETSIGRLGIHESETTNIPFHPLFVAQRLTPTAAAHTYSVRFAVSTGTGVVAGGPGGIGADRPAFIQITRV